MPEPERDPVAHGRVPDEHPAEIPVVQKEGMSVVRVASGRPAALLAGPRQDQNAARVASAQAPVDLRAGMPVAHQEGMTAAKKASGRPAALLAGPRQDPNEARVASAHSVVRRTGVPHDPGEAKEPAMKDHPRHQSAQGNAHLAISAVAKPRRSATWTKARGLRASPAAKDLGARTLHHDALQLAASGAKRRTAGRIPNPLWMA